MKSIETAEQHFAVFYSPGTFVSETSERAVESWSIEEAFRAAQGITERYGAKPFGFDFETRLVTVASESVPSTTLKVLKRSKRHYIDGRVMTLADVERELPGETILISNMRGNGIARVVTGPVRSKGWRWTHQFNDGDVLIDADGREESR